jgi:aldose sugar dehydrogenase
VKQQSDLETEEKAMRKCSVFTSTILVPLVLAGGCEPTEIDAVDAPEAARAATGDVIAEISTEYRTFELVRIADGLENPWAVALLPDGRMLVSERPGRVQLVENGTLTEVTGVPEVRAQNQGGMLDLVPHPDFEQNGWIYMTWSKEVDADRTVPALGRARLEGDTFVDPEELFESNEPNAPGRHYGSRILFLEDGTLLVTVGDRGSIPEQAQDTETHTGTVVRLNDDGSVPTDNPFVDQPGYAPEIYSYGHRNIQGIVQHPETGEIWATEHGPRGGDELNRVEAGANYGWPVVSQGRDYRTQEQWGDGRHEDQNEVFVDPVWEFLPTLAPSGLAVVPSGAVVEQWDGNLLAGGLSPEWLLRIVVEDGRVIHMEEILKGEIGRIRDVRTGPAGSIYLVTDETDGGLYLLTPVD